MVLATSLLAVACGQSPEYFRGTNSGGAAGTNRDGGAGPGSTGGTIVVVGDAGRQGAGGDGAAAAPGGRGSAEGGAAGGMAGGMSGGPPGETTAIGSGGVADGGGAGGVGTGTAGHGPGTGGASGQGGATGAGSSSGGRASGGGTASGGGAAGSGGAGGVRTGGPGGGGVTGAGGASAAGGAPETRVLSIDFVGGIPGAPGARGGVAMARTEVAGVVPAKNWNSAPGGGGSLASLVYSDGSAATGTKATWSAPKSATDDTNTWSVGYGDTAGDVRMMNGYLDPSWDGTPPATAVVVLTVSGLPTSSPYDVYVYATGEVLGGGIRTYAYSIGAAKATITQISGPVAPPSSPFVYTGAPEAGLRNYVVFRQVTGATFSLSVKPPAASDGHYRSPVNGVQIVWPNGP